MRPLILLVMCSQPAWSQVRADLDARELGRRYQKQLESCDAEALWPRLTPPMQKLFGGSPAAMKKILDETRQKNGDEVRLAEEREQYLPDGFVYARRVRFERGYVQFTWWIDREGRISGLRHLNVPLDELAGEAPTKFADYQTKTALRLPFGGTWHVFWGGRTVIENRHAATIDQRFGYDLDAVKDGKSHDGDGGKNEQYFTFGQPIFAPGDGKVFEATDGIADNKPGDLFPDKPCGNHVIVDHGNGEFSFLCHLQKGSVVVKSGQAVKRGQLVGKAGNSGNSSEPHLHYHLQNTPRQNDGEGLPAQFLDVLVDGKRAPRAEPKRGQIISPAE